jgi:molybdopterin-guanine dinucleotide biosynthesis protein A
MRSAVVELAAVLLAGGEARRFPGKLEYPIDGHPMLARTYERIRDSAWPVYIAGRGSFAPALDQVLDAPLLIDRRLGGGPLQAFIDACAAIRAARIFAIAADQPRLDATVLRLLAQQWRAGDEAVVPQHGGEIEPLAALYSRRAMLRESLELRRRGATAMRDAIARLATRFVPCESTFFHNVNRAEDLASVESAS